MLFEIVKAFLKEQGGTPFVGQSIVIEEFMAWWKKNDEEKGNEFDEVIQQFINMFICNALCCYPNVKWEIRDFHHSTHFLAV